MAGTTGFLTAAEAKEVLEKYVQPVIEKILLQHIQSDIYGAYSPKQYAWIGGQTYRRRGSLLSRMALYHEINGSTIVVTSAAEPEDLLGSGVSGYGAFLAILENGNMGFWSRATGRSLPRPALSAAQEEVDNSSEIEEAAQRGIEAVLRKRK